MRTVGWAHNTVTEEVTLAEEVERIANIGETVAISGYKCHDMIAKEVVNLKDKFIRDQDWNSIALQTRIKIID